MRTYLEAGTLLHGHYVIKSILGEGGMGSVYCASDQRLPGREWAVKEMSLRSKGAIDSERALKQFQDEASILTRLSHRNLPEVADFFSDRGRWFLVMEKIPGKTLKQLVEERESPLREEEARSIALQVLDALHYLHTQPRPIIYRDIKPSNIMITPDNRAVLIDFGIARFYDPARETDTLKMGSTGFAPPEQYRGQGTTDPRSDLYSLGATLHYMLTGRDPEVEAPFSFPPVRSLNPSISPGMEKAVKRALEFEREYRYSSAQVMAGELKKSGGILWQVPLARKFFPPSWPGSPQILPSSLKDKILFFRILMLIGFVALVNLCWSAWFEYDFQQRMVKASTHAALGDSYLFAGLFREALTQYDSALQARKKDPFAHYKRGIALRMLKDPEKARSAFSAALALSPAMGSALREMGALELEAGNPARALVYLDKAASLPGGDPLVHILMAHAYDAQKMHGEAERARAVFNSLVPGEKARKKIEEALAQAGRNNDD